MTREVALSIDIRYIESRRIVSSVALMQDVGLAEDLAQEALMAALESWPGAGVPKNPGVWLTAVARIKGIGAAAPAIAAMEASMPPSLLRQRSNSAKLMLCARHNSGIGVPASACLRMAMIWLSEGATSSCKTSSFLIRKILLLNSLTSREITCVKVRSEFPHKRAAVIPILSASELAHRSRQYKQTRVAGLRCRAIAGNSNSLDSAPS